MDQSRKQEALRRIVTVSKDLADLALDADEKMIAHLLEMVQLQARRSQIDAQSSKH